MHRALLLLLAVFLPFLGPFELDAARWSGKRIHVYDYTGARWDGVIAQAVAEANALMPPQGPRVMYHRQAVVACEDLPYQRRVLSVCEGTGAEWGAGFENSVAITSVAAPQSRIRAARVEFLAAYPYTERALPILACHEVIGHAILDVRDHAQRLMPAESCVYGESPVPGTWDAQRAREVYRQANSERRRAPRR